MVRTTPIRAAAAAAVLALNCAPAAAESARLLNAPLRDARPGIELAVQSEFTIRLGGPGLAQALVDAGVRAADAQSAASLVAGDLKQGSAAGAVKVSVTRSLGSAELTLERLTLYTDARQTVLERREGILAIASSSATRHSLRLV